MGLSPFPNTARIAAMSRRNSGYEKGDDPIDWSGFDQRAGADPEPVEGSAPLAILCGAMVVLGIVAVIWGLNAFGAQLEQLRDTSSLGDFNTVAIAIAGGLTLIPAIFGFQVASKPVGFVAPTVLGIAGVFIGIVMAGTCLVLGGASPLPWAAAIVLAFLYLVLVVRVHKAANRERASRYRGRHSRPTKDELWDEKNIWK